MKLRERNIFQLSRRLFLLFDYLFWLFVDPSKFETVDPKKVKKVMVVHLGAIGELIAMTPVISALKKKLSCDIKILVDKGKENVLRENPHVSKTLSYLNSFEEDISTIKKENFDLVAILNPGSFKMAYICYCAGIKYRIGGFGGVKRFPPLLYTRRSFPGYKRHAVESSLDVIKQIGVTNLEPKMEFYFSEETKKRAEEKLEKLKVKNYIIVHPCFDKKKDHSSRLWPARKYHKVIDFIIKNYNLDIILTGTNEEVDFAKEVFNGIKDQKRVRLANGMFSFDELGVILSKAKLLIAPSTSIVHLAASFEIPTVNLIPKKRDMYEWYPWMKKNRYKVLFSNKMEFNPNVPKDFSHEGLVEVEADDVIKWADKLLKFSQVSPKRK
jgi:heptosyltransferase I